MSHLTLRPFFPDDLDRVSGIESRIAGRSRRGFLEKRLALSASSPESVLSCVAADGEAPVGYAFARLAGGDAGTEDRIAVLDILGVDPALQGTGIGKTLLAGIEEQLRSRGFGTLRTEVVWTNHEMVRFFSSVGFRVAPSRIYERGTQRMDAEAQDDRTHPRGGVRIRSLTKEDLPAVVRIDGKYTRRDRTAWYTAKIREMLLESGIRVSLAVEEERFLIGFLMARVDFGEFGKVEKSAVVDTIGVHPAYGGSGIGRALLSQLLHNLSTLQVESVLVEVPEGNFALQRFLAANGFVPSQRLALTKSTG